MADAGPERPFDRNALEATLADALKVADPTDAPASAPPPLRPPVMPSAGSVLSGASPSGAALAPAQRLVPPRTASAGAGRPEPSKLAAPRLMPPPASGDGSASALRVPNISELTARTANGYSAAPPEPPAEQPTIALRRASRPSAKEAPAAKEAQAEEPTDKSRQYVALEPWSPHEDDIVPRASQRRGRRR